MGGGNNVSRNQGFAEVILERTLFHQMTNVLNNSKFMLSSGLDNSGDCGVAQCDEGGKRALELNEGIERFRKNMRRKVCFVGPGVWIKPRMV